ncbi:MAG: MBL fold metallo-hydrolase [Herpetosiphonaceae bacterium]|nr:MAG: MBL fold metallo-hydrolase [Herpetosiphonaceae bacterium]
MHIQRFIVGLFAENSYIIACPTTGEAAFVDPGDEAEQLWQAATDAGLKVRAILLTHAHLDHVGAVTPLRERSGAPLYLHPADDWLLAQAHEQWRAFGKSMMPVAPADRPLSHGDRLQLGSLQIHVIHTPGHTPGSVCFHIPSERILLGGDTLFRRSVGRTDLPGGDTEVLIRSIQDRLWPLDDEIVVYPGHGEQTTIGEERELNPFVGTAARWDRW